MFSSTETVNNARYVQTQCMLCATQSSKSTSSFQFVVCDDAVVRRTLVLIAFHRSHCFHVDFL